MKKLRLYIARVICFAIFFPLALGVSELAIRYFNLKEIGEPRSDAVQSSYMPARLRGNYRGAVMGLPFITNRYGFRQDSDFSLRPLPDEFRILTLGDSIGVGVGVKASEQYATILEKKLNQSGNSPRFRVLNAAGQGYSPSTYLVYLKHEALQFRPRLVIVQVEMNNDITDEALLHWETAGAGADHLQAVRGGRYVIAWDGNLIGTCALGPYFFEKTYSYTLLLRRALNLLHRLNPRGPFHSQPGVTYYAHSYEKFLLNEQRIEAGWQKTFAALNATHRFLEAHDIAFLVLFFPSRYMFDEASGDYGRFARKLVTRATALAQKDRIPHLDLAEAIQKNGGEKLYFDFAHLTQQGNRVVGEEVAKILLSTEEIHPSVRPLQASGGPYSDP